ncbi:hypothetical protein [Microbacterium amylolyticum]|uniref:Uncharacterized protein n=2 Tax=Microbacterium amylolyticum TaxID=936337 RepID=A0ABS4ZJX7_9MICO|nr:hypothetical protein [Microbacterium amylolyticum]MBP2437250.1 hypothetical protein [Microbacterium amylolyticum]
MRFTKPVRFRARPGDGWGQATYEKSEAEFAEDARRNAHWLQGTLEAKFAEDLAPYPEHCRDEPQEIPESVPYRNVFERANLTVDIAGPYWSGAVADLSQLTEPDRRWVFDRLAPTATAVGREIGYFAKEEKWTWIWGQPQLLAEPPKEGRGAPPKLVRPDIVVGGPKNSFGVIDLSVSSAGHRSKLDAHGHPRKSVRSDMARWIKLLQRAGYRYDSELGAQLLLVEPTEEANVAIACRWERVEI